ncbi:jg3980 [Pararge aegeria aegeria]|uniref:Jg3980 protein n=1 Tax=Pararge aegeria aegeria TaxID=348720 RepID=A0A8S4S070_9NEOP|nr:jg3980 [Pararge aegeria aegeria]
MCRDGFVAPQVHSALPAIDARSPAARPHVALKLKKCQRELDRKNKIQSDNFSLLQRLGAIMRVNRLDNHWEKPLPNFHKKVGQFYDADSMRRRLSSREPLSSPESFNGGRCYACEYRKMKSKQAFELVFENEDAIDLPPIKIY